MASFPGKRLLRSRWLPGTVALLLGLVVLTVVVRGTWADTSPRDPGSIAEGPVCQVFQDAEGKQVRCAIRLPFSLDEVWAVITDYDHFGDVCPYLHRTQIEPEPDGKCRLQTAVDSPLGSRVPFSVQMHYQQDLYQYVASWDQPEGALLVNRGRWELTPVSPRETLLVLCMEVQMRGVPTCLLRTISLQRLPVVARAVAERLRTGPSGKEW
jgi:hypothetical protein